MNSNMIIFTLEINFALQAELGSLSDTMLKS